MGHHCDSQDLVRSSSKRKKSEVNSIIIYYWAYFQNFFVIHKSLFEGYNRVQRSNIYRPYTDHPIAKNQSETVLNSSDAD